VFSHWSQVNGSPFEPETKAGSLVNDIRKRKGLKEGIPELANYLDKLWGVFKKKQYKFISNSIKLSLIHKYYYFS